MEFKHIPIMREECINFLNVKDNGTYVDGTVGGGGHSSEILKKNVHLFAIDKDVEAINVCKERFKEKIANVTFINDDFKNYSKYNFENIDGILLDLGVSSYQIDNSERGFSYMSDAPLDMRMNQNQEKTAEFVVNNYSEEKLLKIFYEFGEERFSKNIVKNILIERPINSTKQLADIIKKSIPQKFQTKGNPCKKVFQALRIEVNDELKNLEQTIIDMAKSLKSGGRLCIITFHSLEDRIVKNAFKELSTGCVCPPKLPVCVCNHKQVVNILTKKPIEPTEKEQEENSRSRCAKLRVCEKI